MTIHRNFAAGRVALGLAGAAALAISTAPAQEAPLSAAEVAGRLGLEEVMPSDWDAGFPETVAWRPDLIRADGADGVALEIATAPPGAPRPFLGSEFQTRGYEAVWGRVEWRARLPRAPSGSVAAMFLYKTPHDAPGNRELDLEYLPGDPKVDHPLGSMQMALHMAPEDGRREHTEYRVDVPESCVDAICGWAVEFQPRYVEFQLQERPEDRWRTVARFTHGAGWDPSAGARLGGRVAGEAANFSGPDIWSEQAMKAFASYWASNDLAGWIGPLDEAALARGPDPFILEAMTLANYDRLPAPGGGDWRLTADGAIAVTSLPESDLEPTGIEYRVDGGAWRQLGPAASGVYPLLEPVGRESSIEIRTVARGPAFAESGHEVVSPPSVSKPSASH